MGVNEGFFVFDIEVQIGLDIVPFQVHFLGHSNQQGLVYLLHFSAFDYLPYSPCRNLGERNHHSSTHLLVQPLNDEELLVQLLHHG